MRRKEGSQFSSGGNSFQENMWVLGNEGIQENKGIHENHEVDKNQEDSLKLRILDSPGFKVNQRVYMRKGGFKEPGGLGEQVGHG